MSGARLQSGGQLRNIFPYYVVGETRLTLTIPVAFTSEGKTKISPKTANIPFDMGPDKSDRNFIVINGLSVVARGDAGTTTQVHGFLFYLTPLAQKVYLLALDATLATPIGFNNPGIYMPSFPYNADSVDNVGEIGFENVASVAGTATNLVLHVGLNLGIYGVFAEPDWNAISEGFKHEHTGLNSMREGDLSDIDWRQDR